MSFGPRREVVEAAAMASAKQAAEERRKNPPRKIVAIFYNKDKRLYSTYAHAPKLLLDQPQEDELSHYAVVFQGMLFYMIAVTLSMDTFLSTEPNTTLPSFRYNSY